MEIFIITILIYIRMLIPTKKGIWKIDLSTNKLTQIFATENVNGFDVEQMIQLSI